MRHAFPAFVLAGAAAPLIACVSALPGGSLGESTGDAGDASPDAAAPPKPTLLVAGVGASGNLAVDTDNVYWAAYEGLLMKVPIRGGTPVQLATITDGGPVLVAYAGSVYWSDRGAINRVAVEGGPTTTMVNEPFLICSLAVNSQGIFWTACDGTLKKVGLAGGAPMVLVRALATQAVFMRELAVDDQNIYWTVRDELGDAIRKIGVSGGEPLDLARDGDARGLGVDATQVYWVSYPDGILMTVGIYGGSPKPAFAIPTLAYGHMYAVDATGVYWFEQDAIFRGVPPTSVGAIAARGAVEVGGITLGPTSVCWVGANSNELVSIFTSPK